LIKLDSADAAFRPFIGGANPARIEGETNRGRGADREKDYDSRQATHDPPQRW
jgi:hypothetical protein